MIGRYESPLLQIACILAVLGISCPASASPVLDGANGTIGRSQPGIELTSDAKDWVSHTDIALQYKIFDERATFGGGRVQCNAYNGHLVSTHDKKTLGYANALRNAGTTSYIHVGIYMAPNGGWTSDATGESVTVPWEGGVQIGDGDCLAIDGNGKPVAAKCNARYSFICQRKM